MRLNIFQQIQFPFFFLDGDEGKIWKKETQNKYCMHLTLEYMLVVWIPRVNWIGLASYRNFNSVFCPTENRHTNFVSHYYRELDIDSYRR